MLRYLKLIVYRFEGLDTLSPLKSTRLPTAVTNINKALNAWNPIANLGMIVFQIKTSLLVKSASYFDDWCSENICTVTLNLIFKSYQLETWSCKSYPQRWETRQETQGLRTLFGNSSHGLDSRTKQAWRKRKVFEYFKNRFTLKTRNICWLKWVWGLFHEKGRGK